MPVCEKCQAPYEEWQHFCLQCGQILKTELPLPRRCAHCGAQLGLEQNFCQQCAAPVKNIFSGPKQLISRWKWLTVGLIVALVLLGVSLVDYYLRWPAKIRPTVESPAVPGPRADMAGPGEERVPEPRPPLAGLEAEFSREFNQIKEANQRKDIVLYMNTLSAVFPELDKKRREISQTWEKFDFNDMAFAINGIRQLNTDSAVVEVAWNISTLKLATNQLRQDNFSYRVWFGKELGQWRITKIEEIQP